MNNPYHGYDADGIREAQDEIDRYRLRFADLLDEMRDARIHGVDVAEFRAYFDAAWADTIDVSRKLADGALEDQRNGMIGA